ncbi:protein FIP1-like isoform X2 [Lycium barbarum]|uniref:protein FIP1-like isoform X2 n=1 Tax=Lycium barbarum TaxID=112863 RepID=UPI00293E34C5|nr:protein FIP1-like isoform X2 [Lycium barbarum]
MSTEIHSSLISTSQDENNLFVDVLHEAPLSGHRKPTSLIGSIFYCFLLASFAILAVGATWIFHPIERLVFPLLCSFNVALLVVTGIIQQYLVYQVKKIRLQELLRCCLSWFGIHILASFLCRHCSGYVHQYNSLDSQPDVLKSLYSPLQPSSSLEGLRYQDGGRLSDQQMALLQYQQENIHFLSEEILGLQETLSKYERSNDGGAPQVDLAHLLATRDQELRTLKAEMNQLQSELRLARSIIEEKDAEIQRIRNTNNQYVEENERLRAILGEWSNRAAKLERALELERMSNLELQKKLTTLKTRTRQ